MRVPALMPVIRSPLPVNTSVHQTPHLRHPAPRRRPRRAYGSPGPDGPEPIVETEVVFQPPLGLEDAAVDCDGLSPVNGAEILGHWGGVIVYH